MTKSSQPKAVSSRVANKRTKKKNSQQGPATNGARDKRVKRSPQSSPDTSVAGNERRINSSGPSKVSNSTPNEGTISILQVLARRDQYAIRDKLRIERSLSCFVNQFMSEPGLPKGEFEKAMKISDGHIKQYRTTGDPGSLPVEILGDISDYFQCLNVLEQRQKEIQKQIETHAQKLHVWLWWNKQPGLGAKGLGLIVGHAGNIGTFNKAAGIWQRMGLRNIKFKSCPSWGRYRQKGEEELTKEEWVEIGYNGRRRSVVYSIVDSLLRKQRKVKDKELDPPERWQAEGEYGQLAIDRYIEALKTHEDWTSMHRQLDVNRIVGKRLLADLLKVWKS